MARLSTSTPITLLVLGPAHPELPAALQQLRQHGVLAVHTDNPLLARQWLETMRPDQLLTHQALDEPTACPTHSWDGQPATLLAAWSPKSDPMAERHWGPLWLSPRSLQIAARAAPEQRVAVPATEMRLLLCLVRHEGRAVTRAQLIAEVWPDGPQPQPRSVDQVVRRLRDLLRPLGLAGSLRSLRGLGYRLDAEVQRPLANAARPLI